MSYSCCNMGFLNVDIDADTSKLQAKEEKFNERWVARYFSIQNTFHRDYFFIQLSKAVFLNPIHMPQRLFSSVNVYYVMGFRPS